MTKNDFLSGLDYRLKKLPWEERQNAMHYYMEYFDEAGPENEQKVLSELGSPQAVAAQIMSDCAIKGLNSKPAGVKKGLSTIWVVILAIFAAPIALPLAFAFAMILLSVFIVLFSLVAVGGALIIAGIACIIAGLVIMPQSFPTTMSFAGGGLVVIGVGILILIGMIAVCKGAFYLTSKMFKSFSKKGRKNKAYQPDDYAQCPPPAQGMEAPYTAMPTAPQTTDIVVTPAPPTQIVPQNKEEGVVIHDEKEN